MTYSAAQKSLKCPYCSAVIDIALLQAQETLSSPTMAPQAQALLEQNASGDGRSIVPMQIELPEIENALYCCLASGAETPDDLIDTLRIKSLERFYAPTYFFSGEYEARWTASFGYARTEHVLGTKQTFNLNTKSFERRLADKQQTVIDWTPASGSDTGRYMTVCYAGAKIAPQAAKLIEPPSITTDVTHYDAHYVAGIEVEAIAVSAESLFESKAKPQINQQIDTHVHGYAQGDYQKDWHWHASYQTNTLPLLLPVAHACFEYRDQEYHFWVDGTDINHSYIESLPIDFRRKHRIRLGFVPLITSILLLAYLWLWGVDEAVAQGYALLGLLLTGGYAYARKATLQKHSAQIRQARLAQYQAAKQNIAKLSPEEQKNLSEAMNMPPQPLLIKALAYDALLLPLLCVLSALIVGVPALSLWHQHRAVLQPKAVRAPAATAPQSASNPATASQPATAPLQTTAESQPIEALLQHAAQANWPQIEADIAVLEQKIQKPAHGNVKAGRTANVEGMKQLQAQQYEAALTSFTDALEQDPANIEIRHHLSQAQLQTGQTADAFNTLIQTLLLAPYEAPAWQTLAEIEAKNGDRQKTDQALRLALYFTPQRDLMLKALAETSQAHPTPLYREVVSMVIADATDIPQHKANPSKAGAEATDSPKTKNRARRTKN